ncbi:AraC family transcriptional regulator [Bradyrhizobium cytisi]|uniref:Helix-turn-helix domain-containing protein n=1 Tax=Bradyrhizobium cytisi TaxID=515489 RepID=A0A5S4WF66_9BRAD|nr:AraC family transcriptional regulator [Bradyrhizobium cytisi]TYL73996.1 helix-turn-helix domain-containing protein [Bradyrhizobium cytisi]
MPWSGVLSFTDSISYQAAFQSIDIELLPAVKGKFHAELTQVGMNKLWVHAAHEDLPRICTGAVKPRRAAFGFLTRANQPAMQHCGTQVLPGDIVINDTDLMFRRTEADCDWGAMSLSSDDFEALYNAVTGHEFAALARKHPVRPPSELMSRLLNLHAMTVQLARTAPDILSFPSVIRALEEDFILVIVRCLTEGQTQKMTTGGRRHDLIMARFEEFLECHPDRPLYLTEICAAIGVAERTLRAACEAQLGMAPIRFLSMRRFHLVRRALRQADPSKTTVTRIAIDHGFWELGRFSVAYRALFDESPSESLRRSCDNTLKESDITRRPNCALPVISLSC